MGYGTYTPFDYQLLASLGPNIINAQLSGQKMLDMEEERRLRELKRQELEKEIAFKKGLGEYYAAESNKPSMLGPPPGPVTRTEGAWGIGGTPEDVYTTPPDAMEVLKYNQAKALEKKSPSRLAADYALKSGNLDYYLHFEKAAQAEEDTKRRAATEAMRDIISVWDKFGDAGMKAAWPMLEAAHPEMLKGVDPGTVTFKKDEGVVEVTLEDGRTKVVYPKGDPRHMAVVPHRDTPEEEKAKIEKIKAETESLREHGKYYGAAAEQARARADYYRKQIPKTGTAAAVKVTPAESATVEDYVATQYFNHFGKAYDDPKWAKDNPPSLAAKYGGKGGMFKKFVDEVYDPIRTGKGSPGITGAADSRQGLYPSGTTIKNNFDWVSQRTQQLYSYKVPIPQAYAQATAELNQIIQSQVGPDYSKVDWRKANIQLPPIQLMSGPQVQIPPSAPVGGPATDTDDEFPLQEFDYDPLTKTLKPRLR